jgi:hypothetical protein
MAGLPLSVTGVRNHTTTGTAVEIFSEIEQRQIAKDFDSGESPEMVC